MSRRHIYGGYVDGVWAFGLNLHAKCAQVLGLIYSLYRDR